MSMPFFHCCSIVLAFLVMSIFPTIFASNCSLTTGDLCAKTQNFDLCIKKLNATPSTPANLPILCPISVNLTQDSVTSASNLLTSLLEGEKDPDVKKKYGVCLKHYGNAIGIMKKCGDLAKSGEFRQVGFCVSQVLAETTKDNECNFSSNPKKQLEDAISEVQVFGSLALAISAYLSIC